MKIRKLVLLLLVLMFSCPGPPVLAQSLEGKTPSGIMLTDLPEHIDGFMSRKVGVSSPGAAVVVVKDGRIIFSKGYGFADVVNAVEVDPGHTVFEYGSISKLFVYTTIMRLWEEGQIDLEADIRSYLPEGFLQKLEFDQPITMLDIMNHTTGFEDYLFDVVLPSTRDHLTMEEALVACQPAQVYEPGRVSSYSNYAVALAAHIAEEKLGERFCDYLKGSVFQPLGMELTTAHPGLSDRPELLELKAKGYLRKSPGEFSPGPWSYIPLYPVGGINGTAEDLARFAMALMPPPGEPGMLFEKEDTDEEMFTQTFRMGPGMTGFAHGFIEWDGAVKGFGHGGNTASFSTQMNIVPEDRFGVIILTNAASEIPITSGLTEALLGKGGSGKPVPGEGLPDAGKLDGAYVPARRMHSGFLELYGFLSMLEVEALDQNRIELRMAGQSAILVQTSPYVFERLEAEGEIFEHHFNKVFFDVEDGVVQRLSGDFLPLPPGRSMAWLSTSVFVARAGTAYFLGAFISLFVGRLYREMTRKKKTYDARPIRTLLVFLVLIGLFLVLNNGLMAVRMLTNNYRSFEEMRIHIFLNYALSAAAILTSVGFIRMWRKAQLSRVQRIAYMSVVPVLAALIALLANWQFFTLL
jgi:CubicO group peptidase (beta-lactamase class C family)